MITGKAKLIRTHFSAFYNNNMYVCSFVSWLIFELKTRTVLKPLIFENIYIDWCAVVMEFPKAVYWKSFNSC